MTTALNAAILLFDLLFTPFVLGVLSISALRLVQRKPQALRMALLTGTVCAAVHALGVFLQVFKDGDWLAYLLMTIIVALMAMLIRAS